MYVCVCMRDFLHASGLCGRKRTRKEDVFPHVSCSTVGQFLCITSAFLTLSDPCIHNPDDLTPTFSQTNIHTQSDQTRLLYCLWPFCVYLYLFFYLFEFIFCLHLIFTSHFWWFLTVHFRSMFGRHVSVLHHFSTFCV